MIKNYFQKTIKLNKKFNDKNANIEISTNYNGKRRNYKHKVNINNLSKILNILDKPIIDLPIDKRLANDFLSNSNTEPLIQKYIPSINCTITPFLI
jgi:hypothetical protein